MGSKIDFTEHIVEAVGIVQLNPVFFALLSESFYIHEDLGKTVQGRIIDPRREGDPQQSKQGQGARQVAHHPRVDDASLDGGS